MRWLEGRASGKAGLKNRVEWLGLRPATLPHHRTCGFPHPAIERSGLYTCREIGGKEKAEPPQNLIAESVL